MAHTEIIQYDPAHHEHLLPILVELHVSCIEYDNALMRFHPPFDDAKRAKMLSWWKERVRSVPLGERIMLLAMTYPQSVQNEAERDSETDPDGKDRSHREGKTGEYRAWA
jgi:hypothetical protein